MPSLRRLVPVVALLVALGLAFPLLCEAAPDPPARQQPATSASPGAQVPLSREWKRLPSAQFTIVGTSSAKDMAQLAVELETFLAVLQQMTPSLRLAAPVPTYVVALKDFGTFTSFQPRGPGGRRLEWVAGYFSSGPDGNYLVAPWGGKDRDSLAVMLHELTHHLASRNVRGIPTWLAEGVAEFYSTFRIDAVAAKDVRAYFQGPVWEAETAPYVAFLGALALRRLKQDDEAASLLTKAGTVVAAGTWTAKALDYMQRKTAAAAFLASATNDGERTEAHTYIGFDDALGGRRDAAIAHFRWVKDKGSRNFVEYPLAAAELKRLEASRSK